MLRKILGALALLVILCGVAAAVEEFYPFEVATGQIKTPSENLGAPWFQDGKGPAFGTDKDFYIKYGSNGKLNFNGTGGAYFNFGGDLTFYTADPANDTFSFGSYSVLAPGGITGDVTGTASRIAAGNIINESFGLSNSSNKIQVDLKTNGGLSFSSGDIQVVEGDGIDIRASGVAANVTDLAGNGLEAVDSDLRVKPADASLNVTPGGAKISAGVLAHVLKDGTAAATNVTVSGLAVGDELISVFSQATKASIATITDRTSEYAVGTGTLVKAAGTNETGNQLDVWYWDRTA